MTQERKFSTNDKKVKKSCYETLKEYPLPLCIYLFYLIGNSNNFIQNFSSFSYVAS